MNRTEQNRIFLNNKESRCLQCGGPVRPTSRRGAGQLQGDGPVTIQFAVEGVCDAGHEVWWWEKELVVQPRK